MRFGCTSWYSTTYHVLCAVLWDLPRVLVGDSVENGREMRLKESAADEHR